MYQDIVRRYKLAEKIIAIKDDGIIQTLFGSYDENIRTIQNEYDVVLISRNDKLKICGNENNINLASEAVLSLLKMIESGNDVSNQTVRYITSSVSDGNTEDIKDLSESPVISLTASGRAIRPRTAGQKRYVDSIRNNTIVFGVGPAGTGKTYLAVAMAVKAFKAHMVTKIILTRPAVEAGEKLGFLPGDLQEKVDPYLRPLYDALQEMFGIETFANLMEKGIVEVAPLAYMRGRTLDDAFIILDESQNTTSGQLKMFLTRLGSRSRMVVTGDITQIDLPDPKKSGLLEAIKILDGIDDIKIHKFTEKDVVRHKLVQDIIAAYEKHSISFNQN